jgi:hypothetical protein
MAEDTSGIDSKAGGEADDVAALKKHNQTLLSEKKKVAAELAEMKAQFDKIEQEKLETQGKFKELNESLKKQLQEKDERLKSVVKEFGSKTLKSSFAQEAQKAGCLDPDALYKLADLSTVNIGDDFSFDQEQLKSIITESQKSKSYLFKKDAAAPKDATPNNKTQTSAPTDLLKKKPEELQALLAATLQQA